MGDSVLIHDEFYESDESDFIRRRSTRGHQSSVNYIAHILRSLILLWNVHHGHGFVAIRFPTVSFEKSGSFHANQLPSLLYLTLRD